MSTIEDVAKLAGLSRTTVSRVINSHPYVSEAAISIASINLLKKGFVILG
ncbi:LacI family DNA-binding transcriptional regulator, partial [Bacillus sp. D-CC]